MADSLSNSSKQLSMHLTKRIRLFAVVTMLAAGTLATLDAEAKRMGGGRSFGRQSQATMQRDATPPAQQSTRTAPSGAQTPAGAQAQRSQNPQPVQATPARSRWLGPIAGLAAGLGIAALLSHFGLGGAFASAMANVIVIALVAMVGIWLVRKLLFLRRRSAITPALAGAGGASSMRNDVFMEPAKAQAAGASGSSAVADAGHAAFARPDDFDEAAFLHHAKVNFVRLQAAWDAGNLADIGTFSTPEVFAELKLEHAAQADDRNQTDVVQLNAELIDLAEDPLEYRASVRYSGLIREVSGQAAQPFAEIWQLSKPKQGGAGWVLAGIEQVTVH